MAILSKWHKPEDLEIHNSLKRSFTDIQGLCLNLVECESFPESNSPDMCALCDSIDSGNLSVRSYLSIIWKDSVTHISMVSQFMWKLDFLLCGTYLNETILHIILLHYITISYCFWLALLYSVLYFFFFYQSCSLSLCTVFDAILSKICKVLLINSSANVFVFGDFNVHDKDWLTYSGRIDRPGELWPYSNG